ncbi:hypothetical protein [Nostoc commune]|uniref:hypothetical protein n=1 Tax=Nostoc commune TaxID=1178 RepID=UPI0018C580C6|nr:hypothetical protein [Nostoc commune]MBG1263203.1 hypothetical protein [Nostoc commune BAE]
MDWNSLSSGLVGTLVGVFLSSFISYFDRVREARNLRIMLSREVEENMHLLSQVYTNAPMIFSSGLEFTNFRFSIWDLGAIKAPSFLHKDEIDRVEILYRKLREMSEFRSKLNDANPKVQTAILQFFSEKGSQLGRTLNPVGKQKLNFINYYFFLSKRKGNTVGEGNYHYVYSQGVDFVKDYNEMPYIRKMIARIKDTIYQIWYM